MNKIKQALKPRLIFIVLGLEKISEPKRKQALYIIKKIKIAGDFKMLEVNVNVNETVRMFAEQYYEKIFYFSLKKTGNQTEAEDLTSEIALDIISVLRKGVIPQYFSAYVWKCARSRYAKWAEKRAKLRNQSVELDEDCALEYNLEENYISGEDLKSLRRELALISKDYREILVSFYIDDKKISQISREFNLPEGTVKRKLFESRKILTEGMKMAREFGAKSYKPENIEIWTSGFGVGGRGPGPHIPYEKKILKNILLEAYCNPSTIEELSLELGVAAPYMEEEVEILVDHELLTKLDNGKYETAFPIISAEAQRQIEYAHLKVKDEYYPLLREVVDNLLAAQDNKKLFGGYQSTEELKWLYMILAENYIRHHMGSVKAKYEFTKEELADYENSLKRHYPKRKHGHWDMTGLEEFKRHEERFSVGHNGASVEREGYDISNAPATFCLYHLHQFVGEQDRQRYYNNKQVGVLWDMYNGKADEAKDRETIDLLLANGVFETKGGEYIPKFIVTEKYPLELPMDTDIDKQLYDKIENLRSKLLEEMEAVIAKDIPKRLHHNALFYNHIELLSFAMFAAVKDGYLKIPEDFSKSMIGAFLRVVK